MMLGSLKKMKNNAKGMVTADNGTVFKLSVGVHLEGPPSSSLP